MNYYLPIFQAWVFYEVKGHTTQFAFMYNVLYRYNCMIPWRTLFELDLFIVLVNIDEHVNYY